MRKTIACSALALSMATLAISLDAVAKTAEQAPTIRTMSQIPQTRELEGNSTALVVIDFQNEYFSGRMPIPDGIKALNKARQLVDFAHRHQMPVFYVRHVGPADGPLFAQGSPFAEFHKDLRPGKEDSVITKATPSAFVGTDLHQQLQHKGIKTLLVAGLMTHMCVSSTARDAVPLGYSVIIPEDATATRDLATWDNQVIDHRVLQRSALAGVADVFAEIKTTQAVLAMPVKA
jgi:nicotinamidase-related amidase